MAIAVVIPGQFGQARPTAHTYARRRLAAGLVVAAIALVLLFSAGHVVANRGGAPASASAIRPAISAAPSAAVAAGPVAADSSRIYVVQPGDTLWSIGEQFHGRTPLADYVDDLVSANGGTVLQVAQALPLP